MDKYTIEQIEQECKIDSILSAEEILEIERILTGRIRQAIMNNRDFFSLSKYEYEKFKPFLNFEHRVVEHMSEPYYIYFRNYKLSQFISNIGILVSVLVFIVIPIGFIIIKQ